MLSVNIFAQNQREIIPTIGIDIDTNTFPIGLQFRNQIKDHFGIAPDIGIAYGSSDKSVIVNMNANLHYVIFFSPDTDFSSFHPLIGGSWHNYKNHRYRQFFLRPRNQQRGIMQYRIWD